MAQWFRIHTAQFLTQVQFLTPMSGSSQPPLILALGGPGIAGLHRHLQFHPHTHTDTQIHIIHII